MKHKYSALKSGTIFTGLILLFFSCRKINEGTEVGGGLIPPIDNITTFETFLPAETDNKLAVDSSQLLFSDNVAIGHINDPEFGTTDANAYLSMSYPAPGVYPFVNKDSVKIDSVILSLSYKAVYGDSNSSQTFRVYEISQTSVPEFSDTILYKLNQSPDFQTTGPQLGQKTFLINKLKDSLLHVRKRDTSYVMNVLRIPIDTSFGRRFVNYDTANTANGAFRNDSIFKKNFKGFAIKSDATGNALTYYGPYDNVNTKFTIYFRYTKNGITDTTFVNFAHTTNGQADIIKRVPGGNWASYLANGNPLDDKLYIQSSPGSYATIRIPALDTFRNSVIHRAELIFTKIPSASDNVFLQPATLFLDHANNAGDTAFTFDQDMNLQYIAGSISYNANSFGGSLRASDSSYRFTLTRYVQGIVTRKEPNHILRLSAPLRTTLYSNLIKQKIPLFITGPPGYGRVVVTGGNFVNPALRVRLRLVYSKI